MRRMVDHRSLNEKTVKDAYGVPASKHYRDTQSTRKCQILQHIRFSFRLPSDTYA